MMTKIIHYETIDSTNRVAKEMAADGATHGTVITADYQTAGRGRFGRQFFSPAGNGIYMSMIVSPLELGLTTPTLITAFAAVVVCDAVNKICGKQPKIKWVNDIFLEGKKICGILTESVTGAETVVLGIGINFSTPKGGFPDGIDSTAGAIFSEDTHEEPHPSRESLIQSIITTVLAGCHSNEEMLAEYKSRMFILGQTLTVLAPGESYEAVAIDVDDIGMLVIKKPNGEVVKLSSGEVSIRNCQGIN